MEDTNKPVTTKEILETSTLDNDNDLSLGDFHIHVKNRLNLQEMLEFVTNVVESCFMGDPEEYHPEVKDLAFNTFVLKYYTDLEVGDLSEVYDVMYGTDLLPLIYGYIDEGQIDTIGRAVDNKIAVSVKSKLNNMNRRFDELLKNFESLEESLSGLFGGIDQDTVAKLADTISNGTFDMDKLVQAYVKNRPKQGDD